MPWARLQARQSGQEVVQLGQAAKRLTIPPNVRYAGLYLEASREARGLGMWVASPAKPQAPPRGGCCNLAYPDMCIPPQPDLDCGGIPYRYRYFRVLPPNPRRFDRDRDRVGCRRQIYLHKRADSDSNFSILGLQAALKFSKVLSTYS